MFTNESTENSENSGSQRITRTIIFKGDQIFQNVVSENSGNQCINYRMMKNFGKINIWRLAKNLQLAEF